MASFITSEDMFLKAFDSTPKLNVATQKKLENELSRVTAIISNPNAEWDHRVQAIKHFRTLVNSGIADSDHFHTTTLKTLEIPFQNNICDLRSQVVRETCITIAFLSCRLQQKFARMAEILLPSLIKLIPNSAKIVSTSASVALRFIIQSTHNSRLIPIIKYQLSTSKSKDIHRALCEVAERIVTIWSPAIMERHISDLQEVLKLGICNSDEVARQCARRAFNVFAEHFREPADKLFNSLDQQRQRMLNNLNHGGGSTLSMNGYGATTTSHLNTIGAPSSNNVSSIPTPSNHHSNYGASSNATSVNLVSRLKNTLTTNSTATTTTPTNGSNHINAAISTPSRIRTPTARSTSAIDVSAQRRARARAVYLSSMYTRPRQAGGSSVNTPAKSTVPSNNSSGQHHHTPSSIYNSANTGLHGTPQATNNNPTTPAHQSTHYNHPSNNQQQNNNISSSSSSIYSSPNVVQQQLQQLQQQQAASAEKRDGMALSKAASYLLSVISISSIGENQIVTTIKYFNSLIEKHPPEIVSKLLPELMPPLVIGIDNNAICVRKASVFCHGGCLR
ncbi:hypothetical protein SUGI_1507300 [Cryptomeria japonica]|uniref:TOG domain-containing protein n=1 Tax=Cryptomeria japonica TaxID=3369 RepID=A0AAD3NTG5_CRYJA|nr:uncharacterized protein LOC131873148 [Cryptomeria japonica]GLJ59406.1 hypothetical protein SUGI_1507300 [Cryptomeria japonica]